MANTTKTSGRGRPSIGPKLEVRVSDELADRLQAWADERDMTRADAMRHLIESGLAISDSASTLNTLGKLTVESLFPETEGDLEAAWDLIEGDQTDSFGTVETHPDRPYTVTVGGVQARGKWIVYTERFDGDDWRNTVRTMTVHEGKAAAIEAYTERLVGLTGELWSAGDDLPLWWEGVDGDYLGYGDTTITWRGLLPEAAVLAPEEIDA